MLDDRELMDVVERAYTEQKTRYIRKDELLTWLKRSGLNSEDIDRAISIGINNRIIRFCYPSSVGGKELVPCYERLSEEERELPIEVKEALMKRASQKDGKMVRIKMKKARRKSSHPHIQNSE